MNSCEKSVDNLQLDEQSLDFVTNEGFGDLSLQPSLPEGVSGGVREEPSPKELLTSSSQSTLDQPHQSTNSHSSSTYQPYQSHVKALLIGIGADEQMAGYGRHRTAFVRGVSSSPSTGSVNTEETGTQLGYAELTKELNKDLVRLWERNLGR